MGGSSVLPTVSMVVTQHPSLLGDATDNGWHVTGLFYTGQVASHISGVWHFAQLAANAPDKNYGGSPASQQ